MITSNATHTCTALARFPLSNRDSKTRAVESGEGEGLMSPGVGPERELVNWRHTQHETSSTQRRVCESAHVFLWSQWVTVHNSPSIVDAPYLRGEHLSLLSQEQLRARGEACLKLHILPDTKNLQRPTETVISFNTYLRIWSYDHKLCNES